MNATPEARPATNRARVGRRHPGRALIGPMLAAALTLCAAQADAVDPAHKPAPSATQQAPAKPRPKVARHHDLGLHYSIAWQEEQWWRVPLPDLALSVQVKLVRANQPDTTCTVGAGPMLQLSGLTAQEAAAQVTPENIMQALEFFFPSPELVSHRTITLGGEPAIMARFRYHADLVAFQMPFEGLGVAMTRDGNVYVAECNGLASRFAEVEPSVRAVLGSLRLDPIR